MHRVLVFGGRDFSDASTVDVALSMLPDILGKFAIIEGGARGADRLARDWGNRRGICVITVNANWDHYGKSAGAIRNGWMLDFCRPTYAVGFPGGRGTLDMSNRLEAAGVPLWLPCK